jgi:hypothetical protein
MSMIKKNEAAPAPASAPAPAPAPAGDPAPAFTPAPASESQRFESSAQRPEYIPEKFWREGKPDIENLAKSYAELTSWKNTKTEELLKTIDAERLKARPETADKYELPEIEGIDAESLASSPLVSFWRQTAYEMGLPQDKFTEGMQQYIDALDTSGPDLEAEMGYLGENAEARIQAVSAWAQQNFAEPDEFEAIQRLGQSAGGIRVLERLMGSATGVGSEAPLQKSISIDDLKQMQLDPRYWNPASRDPAFVKQVDDGFQRLYSGKR